MKTTVRSVALVLILLLPLIVFAQKTQKPVPSPRNRPSACEMAKQRALGKDFSTETIKGDSKTGTKDSCVGAVFDSKKKGARKDDVNSYKCVGEKARVNLSKSGVLITSQGDAKVPLGVCATTICEEGKPCRPAKLTEGLKISDLTPPPPPNDVKETNPKTPEQVLEAQEKLNRLQNEKAAFNAGAGIDPWTDEKEQELKNATKEVEEMQKPAEQKIREEKDKEIETERQKLAEQSEELKKLAREKVGLCARPDGCEALGVVSGGKATEQIEREIQENEKWNTHRAIQKAYPEDKVSTSIKDGFTIVERNVNPDADPNTFTDPHNNHKTYFDPEGKRFMEVRGETGQVTLFNEGKPVRMYDEYGRLSENVNPTLNTPQKFNAFWNEYVGGAQTYKATIPDGAEVHVTANTNGVEKTIPYTDYSTLQNLGAKVNGTYDSMQRIAEWTGGKYTVAPPSTLAEPGSGFVFPYEKPHELTPLSPQKNAEMVRAWEQTIKTLPQNVYENTPVNPSTIYTFGRVPDAPITAGGFAHLGEGGPVWVNTSNGPWDGFYASAYHELGHTLYPNFPKADEWGKTVYGDDWGRAYFGKNGSEVLNKKVTDWPVGFAYNYGWKGGVYEDQSTMFENMFRNYGSMKKAAESDVTLATKMNMVQNSFYKASNGVMNQTWWDGLTPVSPSYTVPRGNLVQRLQLGLENKGLTRFLQLSR